MFIFQVWVIMGMCISCGCYMSCVCVFGTSSSSISSSSMCVCVCVCVCVCALWESRMIVLRSVVVSLHAGWWG